MSRLAADGRVEALIRVTGTVQGVGFRPFIYRLAVRHGLRGYVLNVGDAGVEATVEGEADAVERFIAAIRLESPAVSEVRDVAAEYKPYRGRFKEFIIDKSRSAKNTASGIFPPDIGICPDCLLDMENRGSRWHEYPFTACAWCGPRFTGVRSLPYDRERTHMAAFPMCSDCSREYHEPLDRRFDAQGITCSACGPKVWMTDASGRVIQVGDVFAEAAKLLHEGRILAVKGIGGYHLAALATDDGVVAELRRRKRRPEQPFAVMSPCLADVKTFADPDPDEVKALESWRKPIVLVPKRRGGLSELVAPGLDRVGVMLPYSGVHYMLLKRTREPALIMTSGNPSGVPMAITNEEALRSLNGIADFYVLHDREIVNRCDDSLIRVNLGRPAFIRRSRGYVPEPVEMPFGEGVAVGLGTELGNAAAVTLGRRCYMTQYLGDITGLEAYEFEKKAIEGMCDMLKITRDPDVIACDDHPGYLTSQLGRVMSQDRGVSLVTSQHHHAHIASVCAENGVGKDEKVVGIALDGAGYGPDGSIWGGEIIISDYKSYERYGHLEQLPMPGGDECAYNPDRMLLAALSKTFSDDEIRDITQNHVKITLPHSEKELETILRQARRPDCLKTSSCGRLLDAYASLIGVCHRRTYEGEPAMKLEAHILGQKSEITEIYPLIEETGGKCVLKTSETIGEKVFSKENSEEIAQYIHKYLATGLASIAKKAVKEEHINKIALSGGVLVNKTMITELKKQLNFQDIEVITHKQLPPGDGGVALGQACIAFCM